MSKILNVVIILIVIAGMAYGYYYVTKPEATDPGIATPSVDVNGMPLTDTGLTLAEQDPFVKLLNELNAITIDTEFLESGALLSFVDYTRALRTDTVGRDNPFAPSGTGSSVQTKKAVTTVTTKKTTVTTPAEPVDTETENPDDIPPEAFTF